jgi:hypothetical protein
MGGLLQGGGIRDAEEGIPLLAESDSCRAELLGDEGVAVEIEGHDEGKIRGDLHHHGPQSFVAEVEVIVRKAAPSTAEETILGAGIREGGRAGAKGITPFLALENAIDPVAVLALHALQPGADVFVLAAFGGPFKRQTVLAGIGLYPSLIFAGGAGQNLWGDRGKTEHISKVKDHVAGAR